MSSQDPFSLFSQSAKKNKSDVKKNRQSSPKQNPEISIPPIRPFAEEEVNEMIEKMIQMHDEIEMKLRETYEKSGFTHKDVTKYLDNPQNFSSEQWQLVTKQKEELSQKIWSMLGDEAKQETLRKKFVEKDKELKRKGVAGRKKWIPMR